MTTDTLAMRKWKGTQESTEVSLWSAAKMNDVRRLTVLIYNGANIDKKDHRGYSPLMLAVYAGAEEATSLLLEAGADPNSCDDAGNTVLMGAAFKGYVSLARLLIARGADPLARNSAGLSARDFAITFGRRDVAAVLENKLGSSSEPSPSRAVLFFKIIKSRLSGRGGGSRSQVPS